MKIYNKRHFAAGLFSLTAFWVAALNLVEGSWTYKLITFALTVKYLYTGLTKAGSERAKHINAHYDETDRMLHGKYHVLKGNLPLIVLAGFLVAIPAKMVEKYSNRIINIHPSLIPSFCGVGYYGLKVHEKVLERGNKVTGATVHYVDAGTDTGPIILQKAVEIKDGDTPEVLQRRVMEEAEWKLLPAAIQLIADRKKNKE